MQRCRLPPLHLWPARTWHPNLYPDTVSAPRSPPPPLCSYLGKPVKKAVVTVPAYFNDSQRQATKVRIVGWLAGPAAIPATIGRQ